jgi:UDP-N-acetylglucosamine 2-epimerase (non-hydrolysing)/GDP/UDP-N,N'-diacetylbacillosamine 2-epimerase (hydrolysing)
MAGSGRGRLNSGGARVRRVAVVTGTRAEYGLLISSMAAIAGHPRLNLQLVATGMHLLRKFGRTLDQIRRDGWRIDAAVPMQNGDDSPLDAARALARGVDGISRYLCAAGTDIVVVLGDRVEAMAGALAAVTTGKILAHIHGGDLAAGDFDDSFRHAITKLAHLHLAATKSAARRIVRMGEEASRVRWVGAPGLDRLRELIDGLAKGPKKPIVECNRVRVVDRGRSRHTLVVQHPIGRSADHEYRVMKAILGAVERAGLQATCLYPNSDRGHSGIVRAIEEHVRAVDGEGAGFRAVRSLPRDDFLRLLIASDVLIGNSSSGIIEAGFAGTPAVDIGSRQRGREAGGNAVIHCAETRAAMDAAIGRALRKRPIMGGVSAYGDGRAGLRIAQALALVPLDAAFRHKLNTY